MKDVYNSARYDSMYSCFSMIKLFDTMLISCREGITDIKNITGCRFPLRSNAMLGF
jgi:hypothetical protein